MSARSGSGRAASAIRAIRDRLRETYGRPVNQPHRQPIAELVRTVLSQNTSDLNRDRAFDRLRERYPAWEEVRDAPTDDVIEALRPGGLANTKAPRIQAILSRARRPARPRLDESAPREEVLGFLVACPASAARRRPA